MTYGDVVMKFFFEAVPTLPVAADVRFEAISAEVFGTKQRRFGPMPIPETQVAVRDVIRGSPTKLRFFMPWGASKQDAGAPLDVLEFMALKQLACLREGLARFGVECEFSFRLEDLTDPWLLGEDRTRQVSDYVAAFTAVAAVVLPGCRPKLESMFTTWDEFKRLAESFSPVFYKVLVGQAPVESLAAVGWTGTLPREQRDHYYAAYGKLYPGHDHDWVMARYFAGTLARVKLGATCVPAGEHMLVCFSHPVPGTPPGKPRLHYRTLPERHTHTHKAPWMARGYLEVSADGRCSPRYVEPEVAGRLTAHAVPVGEAVVAAPYLEL